MALEPLETLPDPRVACGVLVEYAKLYERARAPKCAFWSKILLNCTSRYFHSKEGIPSEPCVLEVVQSNRAEEGLLPKILCMGEHRNPSTVTVPTPV